MVANTIESLTERLREFVEARDWDQFHSPKNLAMALSVEVSEIVEHFQWLSQEQSRNLSSDKRNEVKDEIADVMIFLAMLSDKLEIDPISAAKEKVDLNARKYPVNLSKGKSDKYTDL